MKKKDIYAVLGIIISGIAIAFIINMLLTYGNIIKTNLSNDSWLNFSIIMFAFYTTYMVKFLLYVNDYI